MEQTHNIIPIWTIWYHLKNNEKV